MFAIIKPIARIVVQRLSSVTTPTTTTATASVASLCAAISGTGIRRNLAR
jgi:hypothetical protein